MKLTFPLLAATLLATSALALAQAPSPAPAESPAAPAPGVSPAPGATPLPGATPGKHHRKNKDAADAAASPGASASGSPGAAVSPAMDKAARKAAKAEKLKAMTPAPGGGPGMVWVNTKSKAYHDSSSPYYGKTKHGKYMSEKDAQAEGDHAAPHNE